YWTASPSDYNSGYARVFYVTSSGYLGYINYMTNMFDVRPVINLKATVSLTGQGTSSNPYKVFGSV
ncbi:MAG: hypothetical protein NC483_00825, partial [Ruminococcus sp.]|nr:hypothetical protein [Ruminococcus sp.]